MSYVHPDDKNLTNLHKAMDYNSSGQPVVRTIVSNDPSQSVSVNLSDSAQVGAFSRLRVANASNINEYKNIYGNLDSWDFVTIFGGSGSISYNANASTNGLTVTNSSGDYVIRQTRRYHSYTPGCGQLIMVTGVLAETKNNLTQRIGYFDDSNGIFFERSTNSSGVTINSWNIRNKNSGTASLAQTASQDSWNIDKFDGTGPSGITIDYTKTQIWFIDFQWLGVGRVRCGFDIDGLLYYAHEFLNANHATSTYMGKPSLPIRYEIRNDNLTSSSSTMTTICAAVQTEGGTQDNLWRHSVTTGGSGVTCGTTEKGVIAIRLKNTLGPNNLPNRSNAQLSDFTLFGSQTASYRILICKGNTCISGSPTWSAISDQSTVEYATDVTLQNLSGNSICINSGFISTAQGSATGSTSMLVTGTKSTINQNYYSNDSQIIILAANRIGNQDAVIYAALNWLEID